MLTKGIVVCDERVKCDKDVTKPTSGGCRGVGYVVLHGAAWCCMVLHGAA